MQQIFLTNPKVSETVEQGAHPAGFNLHDATSRAGRRCVNGGRHEGLDPRWDSTNLQTSRSYRLFASFHLLFATCLEYFGLDPARCRCSYDPALIMPPSEQRALPCFSQGLSFRVSHGQLQLNLDYIGQSLLEIVGSSTRRYSSSRKTGALNPTVESACLLCQPL
jgi:hypothetical protein